MTQTDKTPMLLSIRSSLEQWLRAGYSAGADRASTDIANAIDEYIAVETKRIEEEVALAYSGTSSEEPEADEDDDREPYEIAADFLTLYDHFLRYTNDDARAAVDLLSLYIKGRA